MTLTAFDCRLGLSQGRLPRRVHGPGNGGSLFVLGDDRPGCSYDLALGDHAEVTQPVDLTGLHLLRAGLYLVVPEGPAGLAWQVSLVVDGVKRTHATCAPGRQRTLTDLAANVSKLSGPHQVGVRLELVSA